MLQSPYFVYHTEIGGARPQNQNKVPLTSYEVASRLAYFLTGSGPDKELFDAAADGIDRAEFEKHLDRLLALPAAQSQMGSFHSQWLSTDKIATLQRDPKLFPQFSPALAVEMGREVELFADGVIRGGDGRFASLFTSAVGYPSSQGLFDIYGVPKPAGFVTGTPVPMDPQKRAGILTLPAVLATTSPSHRTSPTKRGVLVRSHILCLPIPQPPPDVVAILPEPGTNNVPANATAADLLALHSSDTACRGCHSLFDPIGFGFEAYDALGRFRTVDGGLPVKDVGNIALVEGISGEFDGVRALAEKLSTSDVARQCYANQWISFALGRGPMASEAASVKSVHGAFTASGYDIMDLIRSVANSDAFRTMPTSIVNP